MSCCHEAWHGTTWHRAVAGIPGAGLYHCLDGGGPALCIHADHWIHIQWSHLNTYFTGLGTQMFMPWWFECSSRYVSIVVRVLASTSPEAEGSTSNHSMGEKNVVSSPPKFLTSTCALLYTYALGNKRFLTIYSIYVFVLPLLFIAFIVYTVSSMQTRNFIWPCGIWL